MSSIEERVIESIRQRANLGKAKYGATMDRTDLSLQQWLQHLQEELLDAAVYVEKLKATNCKWKQQDSGDYITQCGELFISLHKDYVSHNINYCPFCGNEINI